MKGFFVFDIYLCDDHGMQIGLLVLLSIYLPLIPLHMLG